MRAPDGTSCNDGLYCTDADRCEDGTCVGSTRDCSGLDTSCTYGACNESRRACEAVAYGIASGEGPFGVATCTDGLDNDCDGATDSGDADCNVDAWWDLTWPNRVRIRIDARAIAQDLADFPVAVRVPAALVAGVDMAGVRFIGQDGTTEIAFEREPIRNDVRLFWVRVPQVDAVSDQGFLWLYAGKTGQADPSRAAVWDDDFAVVFHMQPSTAGVVEDVTGNALTATPSEPAMLRPTPFADGVYMLATQVYRVAPPLGADVLALTPPFTVEAWAESTTTATSGFNSMVARQYGTEREDLYALGTRLLPERHDVSFCSALVCAIGEAQVDGRHVAGTREGGTVSVYADGELGQSVGGALARNPDPNDLTISGNENQADSYVDETWVGIIDEVRISRVRRSDAWLRASALNAEGSWVTLGSLESSP